MKSLYNSFTSSCKIASSCKTHLSSSSKLFNSIESLFASKSLIFPNKNLKVFRILLYWSETLLNISSEATISLLKSVEAIHSLKISAPNVSQIF